MSALEKLLDEVCDWSRDTDREFVGRMSRIHQDDWSIRDMHPPMFRRLLSIATANAPVPPLLELATRNGMIARLHDLEAQP